MPKCVRCSEEVNFVNDVGLCEPCSEEEERCEEEEYRSELDGLASQIYWHVEHGENDKARECLVELWKKGMTDAAEVIVGGLFREAAEKIIAARDKKGGLTA